MVTTWRIIHHLPYLHKDGAHARHLAIARPRPHLNLQHEITGSKFNPCHTSVASLQRSHNVKNADHRGARCTVASNAVCELCNRIKRHAAAFILSMLKDVEDVVCILYLEAAFAITF